MTDPKENLDIWKIAESIRSHAFDITSHQHEEYDACGKTRISKAMEALVKNVDLLKDAYEQRFGPHSFPG